MSPSEGMQSSAVAWEGSGRGSTDMNPVRKGCARLPQSTDKLLEGRTYGRPGDCEKEKQVQLEYERKCCLRSVKQEANCRPEEPAEGL
ncbi:hypothetical protein KOW79_014733 [Hemibagrus wyckioides]|uniref:Uncharacterized protein n=1 Tax=Hemibagrus wyckioides TaxID=337641 RepID=A0A9D3SFI0_9TELE|nr:hypothetical protein KOW79_014733 [Hemibagrus wyckioides]